MATGTVKWFSDDKDFGFIARDDGGMDLRVDYFGIRPRPDRGRILIEGERVSFTVADGPKGEHAVDVYLEGDGHLPVPPPPPPPPPWKPPVPPSGPSWRDEAPPPPRGPPRRR